MFRKDELSQLTLASGDIPGWLAEEYSKTGKKEKDHVDQSRKNILGSIETLRSLVDLLGSAEHENVVHPKLENVVEKSLPLYKKSMMAALTRRFPENPDDFYIAITECLKGCVKSSAGPGRYLIGVFPDEMKSIRAAIDLVGREINSLNPVIAETRKNKEELTRIGQLHESYLHAREELHQAEKQCPTLSNRSLVLRGEIEVISEKISRLNQDPRMKQLDVLHADEEQLKEEYGRALSEFSSLGNMIVHVLKRAEKVAQKDHNMSLAKKTHTLSELLSKSEIPAILVLCQELNEVFPEINVMVINGDISLKNKEEHHYFSTTALIPLKIQEIVTRIESIAIQLEETRKKIDGSGFRHERESLDHRHHLKSVELAELERRKVAIEERIASLKAEIPSILKQTEDRISLYSGKKAIITQNMEEFT
jgi:hypothetical protein